MFSKLIVLIFCVIITRTSVNLLFKRMNLKGFGLLFVDRMLPVYIKQMIPSVFHVVFYGIMSEVYIIITCESQVLDHTIEKDKCNSSNLLFFLIVWARFFCILQSYIWC